MKFSSAGPASSPMASPNVVAICAISAAFSALSASPMAMSLLAADIRSESLIMPLVAGRSSASMVSAVSPILSDNRPKARCTSSTSAVLAASVKIAPEATPKPVNTALPTWPAVCPMSLSFPFTPLSAPAVISCAFRIIWSAALDAMMSPLRQKPPARYPDWAAFAFSISPISNASALDCFSLRFIFPNAAWTDRA